MNAIVGEFGTGTTFHATGSTATTESEADYMSVTDMRREVGGEVKMMSTGEIVESLLEDADTSAAARAPR